jgi:NAD(P)-dependent dehydrogenase (short-subunit alcohol dehydrogenase family)
MPPDDDAALTGRIPMIFDLTGRVALVTGAGQGVGAGICRKLAAQGAAIAVNDLVAERAEATVAGLEQAGSRAIVAAFDVTDYEAVAAAVKQLEAELGPVDVLVNNAGVPEGMGVKPFREMEPAEWRTFIELNLYGVMNCSKAVIDGMCERGHGRIITISSGAGTVGIPLGVSTYGAGKGGGLAFLRHLAMETAASGVTANSLALGLMNNQQRPEVTAHMVKTVPVGRLGEPEDIGALCVYLASDEASWMTGQTIELNGGNITT